jgi:hypothetical protein
MLSTFFIKAGNWVILDSVFHGVFIREFGYSRGILYDVYKELLIFRAHTQKRTIDLLNISRNRKHVTNFKAPPSLPLCRYHKSILPYLTHGEYWHKFVPTLNTVVVTEVTVLRPWWSIYSCWITAANEFENIIIQSPDTDVYLL